VRQNLGQGVLIVEVYRDISHSHHTHAHAHHTLTHTHI